MLIVGSGPSSELVPTHADLFNNECQQAEERLKCDSGIDFNNPGDNNLYSWATAIKAELEKKGVPLPKLKIAEELRILDDLRWRPKVKYRPLQTLARHRVIARFVREERLEAIWSLNWDTLLEIALESIGMSPATNVAQDQFPWKTKYKTFVTVDDYADDDNVFMLHKPHGCVRSLILAKEALKNGDPDGRAERLCERFLITEEEMKSFDGRQEDQDDNFYSEIRVKFSKRSLYTLGWRAAVEEYLLEFLEKISTQLRTDSVDSLCIINPQYYTGGKHDRLSSIYGRSKDQAYIEVEKKKSTENLLSTDDLFRWLQAKYMLGILHQCAPESNKEEKEEIKMIIDSLKPPNPDTQKLIFDWADVFLPAWIRLCWRAGLVECRHEGQIIKNHDIPMDFPDEHIPLSINGIRRKDIESSIPIILSLTRGDAANIDLQTFPGGIYLKNDLTLIIPLPGWEIDYNLLGGLKFLHGEITQNKSVAFVEKIAVLPVGLDSVLVVDEAQNILAQKLSSELDKLAFAKEGGITSIKLEDIVGGGNE